MRAVGVAFLVLGGTVMARNPGFAADAAYGAHLAAECVACHSADGATTSIRPLRFLPYEYLVAALKAYRNGTRANPAMQSVARALGDTEIEALAAYFSG
jgi:cytochrome c